VSVLPADIEALIDPKPEAAARAAYQNAYDRIREFQKQLTDVDAAVAAAAHGRGELMRKRIAGETVAAGDIDKAEQKVRQVETQRQFIVDALAWLENGMPELDKAIAAARGEAFRPVFIEGMRRRIAAAAEVSDARTQLARAEARLAAAHDVVKAAMNAGLRVPADAIEPLRSPMPTPSEGRILMRDGLMPTEAA
jgi:hypothetical protein